MNDPTLKRGDPQLLNVLCGLVKQHGLDAVLWDLYRAALTRSYVEELRAKDGGPDGAEHAYRSESWRQNAERILECHNQVADGIRLEEVIGDVS